ncbi:MAG: fumarate hydratase [Solirubrobacterales bacterium]
MRIIPSELITEKVAEAATRANLELPADILQALKTAHTQETEERARVVLGFLLENAEVARQEGLALCQDTGLAVVHCTIGLSVQVEGDLTEAINEGIRRAYLDNHFRTSVVRDPILRGNTGDNTPCILHTELVPGDGFELTVFPKGAGSENMGRIGMLKPGAGKEGVIDFVVQAVSDAGSNPCPPLVIGVGIGGNMEYAAYLAKKAMMRPIGQSGPNSDLEAEILARVNETGIGPQGLGGRTTALGVCVETFPTHIASLPVAVNLGCHATRRCRVSL